MKFHLLKGAKWLTSAVLLSFMVSCSSGGDKSEARETVVIHSMSEPEGLNPHTTSDAQGSQIFFNLFQSLLRYDFNTLELTPVLAASLPEVKEEGAGFSLVFELRPEARWDNGEPITAKDVEFSLKALLNPRVHSDAARSGFDFLDDLILYEDNPLKFKVTTKGPNMQVDHVFGYDLLILPEYIFDENQIMRNFSVKDLTNVTEETLNDSRLKEFADIFNSDEYSRSSEKLIGSGAYRLERWQTQQRVILEKKENWWGEQLRGENMFFDVNAKRLVYEVINDPNTAVTALKAGKLDVMYVTNVKDYIDLDKSKKFSENFFKSEPDMLSYQYIGLNVRDKVLSDKRTRQALAHLVDAEQINEQLLYGKGKRVVGPIIPQDEGAYASHIEPYAYDVERAQQLLAEAGWEDTDGDGILDKEIDGQRVPFKLTYTFNQGNALRSSVGLMFQNSLKRAGIDVEVRAMDWSKYLEDLKQQKIQVFYGGWVTQPRPDDPNQLWHTESRNGGSNYTGFGNSQTDDLIKKITQELDEEKRNQLYHQWQEILHEEVPYIFLFSQPFRNVINDRFENIYESSVYPGYYEAGFKLKQIEE